jgi:hypothetical protein
MILSFSGILFRPAEVKDVRGGPKTISSGSGLSQLGRSPSGRVGTDYLRYFERHAGSVQVDDSLGQLVYHLHGDSCRTGPFERLDSAWTGSLGEAAAAAAQWAYIISVSAQSDLSG